MPFREHAIRRRKEALRDVWASEARSEAGQEVDVREGRLWCRGDPCCGALSALARFSHLLQPLKAPFCCSMGLTLVAS